MRKIVALLISVLVLLPLFGGVAFAGGENEVRMIGHKGYSEMYPGNTALSFRMAGEAGFDGVETDVRMTKDGILVTSHDSEIETADGKTMKISRCTFDELTAQPLLNEESDDEVYLCSLSEYFDICKEYGMECFVEIKEYLPIWKLFEMTKLAEEHYDIEKCEFETFELLVLLAAKLACPKINAMVTSNSFNFNVKLALLFGFDLDINYSGLSEEIVSKFHGRGAKVCTFTVNDENELKNAASMGVDYIQTDCFPSADAS